MQLGRNRQRSRARFPAAAGGGADFTLSSSSVATQWGVVEVGTLVPSGVDPATVYFVLAEDTNPTGEYAGIAVVNG